MHTCSFRIVEYEVRESIIVKLVMYQSANQGMWVGRLRWGRKNHPLLRQFEPCTFDTVYKLNAMQKSNALGYTCFARNAHSDIPSGPGYSIIESKHFFSKDITCYQLGLNLVMQCITAWYLLMEPSRNSHVMELILLCHVTPCRWRQ